MIHVFAEYIWLDSNGNLRSKNKLIQMHLVKDRLDPTNYPDWNYDGSSTGQASTEDSEVMLKPVRCYLDPFFESTPNVHYILVLCEAYKMNGMIVFGNTRSSAKAIFDKKLEMKPWYGLEQEFFIMDNSTDKPVGFVAGHMSPQGQYYCGVGANNVFCRSLVTDAYRKALKAGVKVSGMNAEVAPGQWEIQVGPVEGIKAGDDLYMLRYILNRVCEEYSERHNKCLRISFDSKPLTNREDSWNGSGMHTNFSTQLMREDNGIVHIMEAIQKLVPKHAQHLEVYGKDNDKRLTGKNETSDITKCTYSVGGRGTSIRIPNEVSANGKGYFEDRRPSASADPYLVTSKIFETCCL